LDPNAIDAAAMSRTADWICCEMIRCFHNMPLEDAQELVDQISVRRLPDVWEVGGRKRVLRTDLDAKDRTLLQLYSCKEGGALEEDVFKWCKYSSLAMYKARVLHPLDRCNAIDFDTSNGWVTISPVGVKRAEELLKAERRS
jgi:hypothetical protein